MPLTGLELSAPFDLAGLMRVGLESNPDQQALISTLRCWTWREVLETTNRIASAYVGRGLRPGDRIASLMPNRPATMMHYLACLRAGFVATPLNYRYTPSEIDHALKVSEASLLVHHEERIEDVSACRFASNLSKGMVAYGESIECNYKKLLSEGDPDARFPTPHADAAAFIFFTSGSTGLPKGVTHTQATVGWILASIISAFQLSARDTVMPGTSFSHTAASMFGLASLAAGSRLALPLGSHPDELLPLLRTSRPTVMFMLPNALSMLVRENDAVVPEDFSSLRVCFTGGDRLSVELEQEYTDLVGKPVEEGYGMTEIGHAIALPAGDTYQPGALGKPCPGYEFSIRDDAGQELPPGVPGRVWVRFPGNTVGYWNHAEATQETIVDGWLDTGDIMFADEEGYLRFQGRSKQIIVHDGSNICPEEVEAAIATHPAVKSTGVVGVHDLLHGENVRAYVTLIPGAIQPTASELIQTARRTVGYKAPEEIVFLPELPVNAAGKVDRMMLKRMAEEQKDRDVKRETTDPT